MRSIKSFFYLLFISTLFFQSCSIEKRHYTHGYSFQWKHSTKPTNAEEAITKINKKNKEINNSVISINDVNTITASTEKKKGIVLLSPDSTKCDTLIMRNETEIKVKVTEITPTEIKYKYCDNLTGPTYVSYRYEVSYIKYANGKFDSFKNEFAPVNTIKNNPRGNNKQQNNTEYTASSKAENFVRKMSVTSIFFGAFSLIPFAGIYASIPAIIFGIICLVKINKDPNLLPYKSKAFTGIILGVLGIIVTVAIIAAIVLLM